VSHEPQSGLAAALHQAGFRGTLLAEEVLAPYTTWRIGGPAELLARPADREDLALAIRWASSRGIPWKVLGNGSNLLVRDRGVRGLVLHLRQVLDAILVDGPDLAAEAGVLLPALASRAAALGLAGLEFAAGIPGTVGGAVVMNAGTRDGGLGKVVASVDLLDEYGALQTVPQAECAFGYRTSVFREHPGVVVAASFHLKSEKMEEVQARLADLAARRKERQPLELPSCGSVFRNPEGDAAGRLIEQAGLKGQREGGIEISPRHANFFVNHGGGTADDVLTLVERAEQEVEARFGVRLTREFELW
jgi:UDP-N-acetylmuramate dehydrogenase